ncbi:xylan 1,4-beta-xylosidase [Spirillospora sp. CA-294931]|uniref:xylan 1,4-beta-xylosidase n=1 Tax=Spirillospora sp. CA-294931 TaxID=3240042 RepID=UPI003D8A2011
MSVQQRESEPRGGFFRTRKGRHAAALGRPVVAALAVTLAVLVASTAAVYLAQGSDEPPPVPTARPATRVGAGVPQDWPAWGFTHTQNTVDAERGPAQALTDLSRTPVPQVTAIMGWGLDNPQPRPGEFDWASLDRRMEAIRRTGGTPVVTLCCGPDWMKGGPAGKTDWSKLEVAIEPEHFGDYARLAAEVAKRYGNVRYFTVWNEFKGFWNPSANRWDYEGYTKLYNEVYTALKRVRSDIRVGGPYMVMNSNAPGRKYGPPSELSGPWGTMDQRNLDAVRYWVKNKKGADFLAVDGHSMPVQREVRLDEFRALAKFSDVTRWLRGLAGDLPVWWAEWYVEPDASGWTDERRGAVHTAAMMEFVRGGAASALYWNPQTTTAANCPGCLWSGAAAGGGATPTLAMLQNFARWFPPGTPLVDVRSSDPSVRVLAQRGQMVTVNGTGRPVRTLIEGKALDLGPYEVKWIGR